MTTESGGLPAARASASLSFLKETRRVTTYHGVNLLFWAAGLAGVWFCSHSGWAVLWAHVAAMHFMKKHPEAG